MTDRFRVLKIFLGFVSQHLYNIKTSLNFSGYKTLRGCRKQLDFEGRIF